MSGPEPDTSAQGGVSDPRRTAPAPLAFETTASVSAAPVPTPAAGAGLQRLLLVLALLYVFLVGIQGLGVGFKLLGRDLLDTFFNATRSPFIGLMVGILATTLVQSSSVTTSMIVGLVAAPENPLPVQNAIPMIMGANIGTTVTSTLAALAHMGRVDEFRRAFAVATCHDFFNLFTVLALLPLELATGYLENLSGALAGALSGLGGVSYDSPFEHALKAGVVPLRALTDALFAGALGRAVCLIVLSALLIFVALVLVVTVMRSAMQTRIEVFLSRFLDRSAVLSILVGTGVTVMVQSSSITTSLLVPLAGAGLITLEQAFPITLGCNIGTTVTALLASLAATGPHAAAGVQIALVHLFFNISGTILYYPLETLRALPLRGARWLAQLAARSRRAAVLYILMVFYAVPALLIMANKLLN